MKKIMFFAAVCAALVSCSKEEKINTPIEGGKPCVLTATIDLGSSGTKVTPDLANISSTLSFKWEVDDIVTISNEAGTESQEFTVKSIDSKGVATLTGTALSSMTSYKVSYGTASATVDYQEGTFKPIITGEGENNTFTLDTYCPVLKLRLTGKECTVTSIKYYVGSTLNTTLTISNGIELTDEEKVIYFPVIGTAAAKGAKLDFCNGDNVLMRQTLPVAVAANDFIALPALAIVPYLCFTALEDGSTVAFKNTSCNLEWSTDGSNWSDDSEMGTQTLSKGKKLYVRATSGGNNAVSHWLSPLFASVNGNLKVSGNVMYLLDQNGSVTNLTPGNNNSCFKNLFNGCSAISDAGDLLLPATTLTEYCYNNMFAFCSSLTSAPALPATTLANYCYNGMFRDCSSLNVAPALPATTLAIYCYGGMFHGCSNLTSTPALPATSLAESCYYMMFRDCSSLTSVPALPAKTMKKLCYQNMFHSCTALTTVPSNMLPATTLAEECYIQMFNACSNLTNAPELPTTTLVDGCYMQMFYNCSSLETAPDLPATTLASSCYYWMFEGCSKLSSVKMLATDVSATNCLTRWLNGAGTSASSRTLKVASGMSTNATITDTNNTPSNWTITE